MDRVSQNEGAESTLAFLLRSRKAGAAKLLTSFKEPSARSVVSIPETTYDFPHLIAHETHRADADPDRSRVLMRLFRPTTDDIARRIVARPLFLMQVARLLAGVASSGPARQ